MGDDAIMLLAWLISCSSILKEYAKVEFQDDLRHQRKRPTGIGQCIGRTRTPDRWQFDIASDWVNS